MSQTFTVTTNADSGVGSLRAAITGANADPGSTITFALPQNATITLLGELPHITANVTIDGSGSPGLTVSGQNLFRVFFIESGTVAIENLNIANGLAKGGDGGDAGGGGGLGAGGAIFVNAGTTTIANVDFTDNKAKGGDGGAGGVASAGGGGGGLAGDGANSSGLTGGIGGGGNGGEGAIVDTSGGDGGLFGGGGGGGGSGGTVFPHNAGDGGSGGFGGGGGGAGTPNGGGEAAGGNGGFGAGGGGGSYLEGQPGWLGGGAGSGDYDANRTGSGGGGAAFGGAVFVRGDTGASLVIKDGSFSGSNVTGGSAGGVDAGAGFAWVSDLFLMYGSTATFAPEAGKTLVFNGIVRDDGAEGALPPSLLNVVTPGVFANIGDGNSTGTVVMGVPGAYGFLDTPGIMNMTFKSGTLHLVGSMAGGLTFMSGVQTLEIDSAAFNPSTHSLPELSLKSFGTGDIIDFTGLTFTTGAHASFAGSVLTVTSGASAVSLFMTSPSSTSFFVRDDGTAAHGTIVYLVPVPLISGLTTAADSGTAGDNRTTDTQPTIAGTGAGSGDTITVYVDGSSTAAGTTTAAADGSWTFSFTSGLSTGAHSITATDTQSGSTGALSGAYSLTIDAVPSAPVITGIDTDTGTSSTDGITTDQNVVFHGTGTDGDTITLSLLGFSIQKSTTVSGGTWSIDFTDITLVGGPYSFAATQTDLHGNVSASSPTYAVNVDRQAPTLTITSDKSTLGIGDTANITFNFSEDPGATFTSSDIAVGGGSLGTLSGSGLTRTAVFTPTGNTNGASESITVAAGSYTDAAGNDGGAGTTPSITFHNDAPTNILLSPSGVPENSSNGTVVGTLSDIDPDAADSATFTLLDDDGGRFALSGNTIVVADGSLLDFESSATRSITVHVVDSSGLSFDKQLVIGLTNVNEAPIVANAIPDQSVAEDTAWSFQFAANAFTDVDNALSYTATLGNGDALPSWLLFDAPTRRFSGTPPANFNGTVDLKVTASDGILSASDTFTLTVMPVNDAPVLADVTNANYRPHAAPVTLSPALTLSDVDSATLIGATMRIAGGIFPGDGDVLAASVAGTAITAGYNAATETLTLSGTDTLAHYQQVLASVTFESTSANPTDFGAHPARTVEWQVNDGAAGNNLGSVATTIDIGRSLSSSLNGNGHSDILWQNRDGTPAAWSMDGTALVSGANVGFNPGPAWHVIGSGDFNGDSKADILWQHNDGTIAEWFMNGASLISGASVAFNPGAAWHAIGTGDFNGDGKADILWQNADGTPAVWLMDGLNILSGANVGFNPGPAWHVISAGDFDGDGKSDILWQNQNGQAAVWLMNGTSLTKGTDVGPNPGTSWHTVGTGDFNGDGKADILWQNTDGTPAIWLMNGTSLISGQNVGFNPGPAWHAINTGDYNGDGKSDILWQNNDGTPAVWLMDGTSLTSGSNVGFNPGTNWHAIPQHHDMFG
jgi:hypothetical protein